MVAGLHPLLTMRLYFKNPLTCIYFASVFHEKQRSPWLYPDTAQQPLKCWCVINTVLIPTIKHTIVERKLTLSQIKLGHQEV